MTLYIQVSCGEGTAEFTEWGPAFAFRDWLLSYDTRLQVLTYFSQS